MGHERCNRTYQQGKVVVRERGEREVNDEGSEESNLNRSGDNADRDHEACGGVEDRDIKRMT